MSRFEEFLQDYEAREREEANKFIKKIKEEEVSHNERYPYGDRFIKLQEPLAFPTPNVNIWGTIPFMVRQSFI